MNFDINRLYVATDGRIGRQDFWMGVIGLAVVSIVVSMIVGAIFGWISFAARLVMFIVQLVLAYPAYALMAKRFQDRDRPGNYAAILVGINIVYSLAGLIGLTGTPIQPNALGTVLGLVVLVVAVWAIVELGFRRGTVGNNQYGPDPLQA